MIWSERNLQELNEDTLSREILVPLFESMGFCDVYYHHGGTLELGKDIVMWKAEPPRDRVDYGVVVKAQKITGAATTLGPVVFQIQQCLGAAYKDPSTGDQREVSHCFVVSSHKMTKEATDALFAALRGAQVDGNVTLIGGEKLWSLVEEHLPQKLIHARLSAAMQEMEVAHEDWRIVAQMDGKQVHFSLQPKKDGVEPLPVSVSPAFPDSAAGRKKLEEYTQFIESGTPVELDGSMISSLELPDFLRLVVPPPDQARIKVRLESVRRGHPLLVRMDFEASDGRHCEIPYLEFASATAGTKRAVFRNDTQDTPYQLVLTVHEDTRALGIQLALDASGRNVFQWRDGLRLLRALSIGGKLILTDLRQGLQLVEHAMRPNVIPSPPDAALELAESLVFIQQQTHTSIQTPEHITLESIATTRNVVGVLRTGRMPAPPLPLRLPVVAEHAAGLLEAFSQDDDSPLVIETNVSSVRLFGTIVPLGPSKVECPGAWMPDHELARLKDLAEGRSGSQEILVAVFPSDGKSIEVTYSNWPRENEGRD